MAGWDWGFSVESLMGLEQRESRRHARILDPPRLSP